MHLVGLRILKIIIKMNKTEQLTFPWSKPNNSSFDDFYEGNYTISVIDNNSCEIVDSVNIGNIPSPIIDFRILSECCSGGYTHMPWAKISLIFIDVHRFS